MQTQHSAQTTTQSTLSRWQLRGRALFAGRKLFSILVLLLINSAMLINGAVEDANELRSLLSEGALYEAPLINVMSFLAYPILSCQLLIGLCWLIFHFFPARRAGVILRKAAFAFCQTLRSLVVHSAHGCRAPPLVNGCL
ncbi:hypothetical protein [Pseudoalteromonas mariniglutinosa]|uniref:hypothetical protein n=1 Tax=Pseudoalteromonas mariniglutinosa TaxID=206042 RepID=UPI003850F37D